MVNGGDLTQRSEEAKDKIWGMFKGTNDMNLYLNKKVTASLYLSPISQGLAYICTVYKQERCGRIFLMEGVKT